MGFSSSGGGGEQLQSYLSPDELHCWAPRPLTSQAKPRFLWSSARQRLPGRFSKALISPAAGLSFLPGTVDVHALSASAYFRAGQGAGRDGPTPQKRCLCLDVNPDHPQPPQWNASPQLLK